MMANAAAMLLFSDQIEAALGVPSNPQEQQNVLKVYSVEREQKS